VKHEIRVQDVDDDNPEVFVSAWLKNQGEEVAKGEPLVEVLTDKASYEIESPVSGTVAEMRVAEEERVQPGQVIAVIEVPES
jgi:pyruvate/2-oxoglutarate dehydrogenase complex dihydrolipoamide acyltransferase (E2) component